MVNVPEMVPQWRPSWIFIVMTTHEKKIVTVSSRWAHGDHGGHGPGPNDHGSVTAQSRRGHSSVTARSQLITARSQLNHGIFSMITAQSRLGHSSVTVRSQLNHGIFSMITAQSRLGHSSITAQVTAQSRLAVTILVTVSWRWAHGELTVSSLWAHGEQSRWPIFSHGYCPRSGPYIIHSTNAAFINTFWATLYWH